MWFSIVLVAFAVIVVAFGVRDLMRKPDATLEYDPSRSAIPPSEHVKGSSGWEGVTDGLDAGPGANLF